MHKVTLQNPPFTLILANFFETFGYLSVILEWFWVFGLILYPYLNNLKLMPPSEATHPPEPLFAVNSTVALIIGIIAILFCLAIVIYAAYAIPRDVAKTSSQVAHNAAKTLVPTITHHKRLNKKEYKRLSYVTLNVLKFIAVIIPLLTILIFQPSSGLPANIIAILTTFFAACAILNFGLQTTIAKLAKLDYEKIW